MKVDLSAPSPAPLSLWVALEVATLPTPQLPRASELESWRAGELESWRAGEPASELERRSVWALHGSRSRTEPEPESGEPELRLPESREARETHHSGAQRRWAARTRRARADGARRSRPLLRRRQRRSSL